MHCAYSWAPILNSDNLDLEHIIPISRGGGTVIFNVVPCLSSINGNGSDKKFTQNLLDWWEEREFYRIELLENLVNYILEAYEVSMKHESTVQDYIYEEDDSLNASFVSINYISSNRSKINNEKIGYNQFIMSCLIKLQDSGINVDSYQDRLNKLQEIKSFEFLEKQRILQIEIFNLCKYYCPEYKYDIATSIDYFTLLNNYKDSEVTKIIEEINKRVMEVQIYCTKYGINSSEVIHSIIKYQDFLCEENYKIEKLIEIALKRLNDLCDELENFCVNNGWFPRKSISIGNSQIKLNKDLTDEERYEINLHGRYNNNSKQLSKVQKERIKKLKKEYGRQKIINTNELFDEIVDFSLRKWFPRGALSTGRKELIEEEKKEKLLYSNYRNHLYKFTKEQYEQLENLKESRSYIRLSFDRQYNDIVRFVEKYGHFPRTTGSLEMEIDLYNSYLRNRDNFTKEQLETLEKLKEDNKFFDFNATMVINELKEFIKKNGRFPQSEIRRNGIRLHASEFNADEQYEVNLYAKFRRARARISEDVIKELDLLRERLFYDDLYETILRFIDSNGHFPVCIIRRENGKILKTEELSQEEQYEKRLYSNFAQARRKNKFTGEQIVHLQELQKSKNIYKERQNEVYSQLLNFIQEKHRLPRVYRNDYEGGRLRRVDYSDDEMKEARLTDAFYRMKDKFSKEQLDYLYELIESKNLIDESYMKGRVG